MDRSTDGWRRREALAWVSHDSPAAPRVSRAFRLILAGSLATVTVAMVATDTLCPEHRAWVVSIGLASFIAAGAAVIALLRGSWAAMPLAFTSALGGVACGVIDASHNVDRGAVIALAFSCVAIAAGALLVADVRRFTWDASLRADRPPSGDRTASAVAPPLHTDSVAGPAVEHPVR